MKLQAKFTNIPGGVYAWLTPTDRSTLTIAALLKSCTFDLEHATDWHTTLLYCTNPPDKIVTLTCDVIKATIIGLDVWNQISEENPNGNVVVLRLASQGLQDLHKALRINGFTHSFEDYLPHITIAYDVDPTDASLAALHKRLVASPVDIELDGLKSSPIY